MADMSIRPSECEWAEKGSVLLHNLMFFRWVQNVQEIGISSESGIQSEAV